MKILLGISIDDLLQLVLGMIMFGVGLSLRFSDFKYIIDSKKLVIVGLLLKLILLPLIGLAIIQFSNLTLEFQFGIMILLFCAGGTTSNVITYWFKGTSALTVLITSISSILSVLIIPFLVNLASQLFFNKTTTFILPITPTIVAIISIIILPAICGILFRESSDSFALKLERILKPLSVTLLAIAFLLKLIAPTEDGGTGITVSEIMVLAPILVFINIAAMVLGFISSRILSINNRDSMTIGIEMGLQNAGMAILIGGTFIGEPDLAKPALLYAFFTFWTALIFAYIVKSVFYEKNWN